MIQFDTPKELREKEKELYKVIKKVHLHDIMPGHSFPAGNEFAIVDANRKILNFCSEIYFPKLNSEIFPEIESGLKAAGMDYRKRINIIGNAKFYVDYVIMERMKTPSVNDVFPKLSVWNSYDGVIKFRKEFGFYKLLCSNGLCRPTEKHSSVSFKHTKNNDVRIGEVVSITRDFVKDSKNDILVFDSLNRRTASEKTLERMASKLKIGRHVIEEAVKRFKLETDGQIHYLNEYNEEVTSNGTPKTMFAVYNALNWATYNCNPKELPEKKLEKDRSILELAMEMA